MSEQQLNVWPTVGPIVAYGDPVLRQEARPVKKVNRRIQNLLDEMAETMYEARGVGLAAPQVGEGLRIVVIDVGEGLIELINPKVVFSEGSDTAFEGCLSVPGYLGKVERAARVQVEALDRNGRRIWVEGEGMLARALQHEIDHLDGVLFVDRAEKLVKMPPETRLKVVFMGTPEFGARVLEEMVESQCRVEAVVTQPDRPAGRGQQKRPSSVKKAAEEYELEVLQPERIATPEFIETLREIEPDVIVTAAFGQLVPKEILELPEIACINVHASLLPKFRGAAPIHRAILEGEAETGITIMYMDEGLDTGDMMLQAAIDIEPDDTAGSLHGKLAAIGADLTIEALRLLATDEAPRVPQDDSRATHARRIKKQEAHVDWSKSATELERLFRAFDPWPGAYAYLAGERLKVFRGQLYEHNQNGAKGEPGAIIKVTEDGIVVAAGQGYIKLVEVQPAGSKRMSVAEFLRGHEVEVGQELT